ncbi:MAG: N-acetylmuramoyl-L-alanine amidase [Caldilineaceae bacterium]|nr:N-acetylmuramoyl-L-alanine amidase [Caldilineaceae bacterium]
MRHHLIKRIQRLFALTSLLLILAIGLLVGQALGFIPKDLRAFVDPARFLPQAPQVALISGHAGYDSGAVCTDASGATLLTEAEINARVADLVAQRLRLSGVDLLILTEYDDRLENLTAPLLLSLHADSCVDLSGYKAAHRTNSTVPAEDARLLACIDLHYPAATGLRPHPNTITHNMTSYHAFRRIHPSTPAAILEMGFLGGDQSLLTTGAARVADGITASIQCFLAERGADSK